MVLDRTEVEMHRGPALMELTSSVSINVGYSDTNSNTTISIFTTYLVGPAMKRKCCSI